MAGMDTNEIVVTIVTLVSAFMLMATTYVLNERGKKPRRESILCGQSYVNELLSIEGPHCHEQIRMNRDCFNALRDALVRRGLLASDRKITVEEQLVMFLHTIGHNVTNRVISNRFNHSGETVSRHFHRVLNAICRLSVHYITFPTIEETPPAIASNNRWYPFFKDCLGAIDGTHIPAVVPASMQAKYRNRKGWISQNCLMACGPDLKFHYVLAGWEGSATDARVLYSAQHRDNTFTIPDGKYYLADAGYSHTPGFMSPFRGVRYHLKEFNEHCPPENALELFNLRHSSLRTSIERAFGVLKMRWGILKMPRGYSIATQRDIVIACCMLHNHIIMYDKDDAFLQSITMADPLSGNIELPVQDHATQRSIPRWTRDSWNECRTNIADNMWAAYHGI